MSFFSNPEFEIIIDVSYKHKEDAKRIGAKWNPNKKYWYIIYSLDSDGFYYKFHEKTQSRFKHLKFVEEPDLYFTEDIQNDYINILNEGFNNKNT